MTSWGLTRRLLLAGAFVPLAAMPSLAQQGEPVLRVVAPWEYTSNDPADTGYILTRLGVAETLVQVEPEGQLVGGIAESWSVSEDKLSWRFKLRAGLSFHDGSPVTAQAVAASLKQSFIGESLSAVPLDSVSLDGADVVIRTRTPFSVLPAFLCDYASIVLAPSAYGTEGKVIKIVATGPYKLTAIDGKTTLELDRFEGYARTKPAIARLRYTAVVNGDTRANIAIAGDADLVYTLSPTATPRINAAGQMKVESLTIPRIRALFFDSGLPQFSDVRVRRAIAMAVDRDGIAKAILRDPDSSASQLLPPIMTGWHRQGLPAIAHDPAAARKLLDEAGWIAAGDGIRVKDGVRLAAKLLTLVNRPELPVMASAIQAQLRGIGMDVAIEVGPGNSVPAAIKDGTMQFTLVSRTYVNVPEPIATIIPDFARERSVWGTVRWDGRDQVKALADAYLASFDDARKDELRGQIIALLHDQMPVVPVSWTEHSVAVSGRIKNVAIDPYEMRYLVERMAWK
ncbi:ABC transporter substrate-binding protein [Bosea sp. 685]|uniref:ABC transporter substrate-binding protein n=1 Tax=Bosea sp. 685 TaxID=3080057 RepID=UPI0028934034|nr:ABC transporter substrate-binding protein [Bosea sp. 685]WNJ90891.1 ABC transporter substrate-binding protein [Bosea sp. 685]